MFYSSKIACCSYWIYFSSVYNNVLFQQNFRHETIVTVGNEFVNFCNIGYQQTDLMTYFFSIYELLYQFDFNVTHAFVTENEKLEKCLKGSKLLDVFHAFILSLLLFWACEIRKSWWMRLHGVPKKCSSMSNRAR